MTTNRITSPKQAVATQSARACRGPHPHPPYRSRLQAPGWSPSPVDLSLAHDGPLPLQYATGTAQYMPRSLPPPTAPLLHPCPRAGDAAFSLSTLLRATCRASRPSNTSASATCSWSPGFHLAERAQLNASNSTTESPGRSLATPHLGRPASLVLPNGVPIPWRGTPRSRVPTPQPPKGTMVSPPFSSSSRLVATARHQLTLGCPSCSYRLDCTKTYPVFIHASRNRPVKHVAAISTDLVLGRRLFFWE